MLREPAFFVCAPYEEGRGLLMDDNLKGRCQLCRRIVQYRPGAPERAEAHHGSVVTMICMICATHDIDKLEQRAASPSRPTH